MSKLIRPLLLVVIFSALYGCASGMVGGAPGARTNVKAAGHAYLVGMEEEEKGYGLYSYLLFESAPTEVNRNLYLEAIKAIIKQLSSVKDLEAQGFTRVELNVTYVPIKIPLPPGKSGPSPEWVLENYNYARAKFFLTRLPGERSSGPYIISTLHPISHLHEIPGPKDHLAQNLSSIPPSRGDLIRDWVKSFLRRASRPKKWNRASGEKMARKLRLAIAIAAEGLPQVQDALKNWVIWVKDMGLTQHHRLEDQMPIDMLAT